MRGKAASEIVDGAGGAAVEVAVPDFQTDVAVGDVHAATLVNTSTRNPSNATHATASQHSEAGAVAMHADGLLSRSPLTPARGRTDAGVVGGGPGLDQGQVADGELRDPTARMRAVFHQTTELDTLAEADALKTPSASTSKCEAIATGPEEGAPVKQRLAYIGRQLNAFGRRGVILERYEMLGGDDRRQGGAWSHASLYVRARASGAKNSAKQSAGQDSTL